MNVASGAFDVFEVTFDHANFDKVHAEALCVYLRNLEEVDLASHTTDHNKLVLKLRLKSVDGSMEKIVTLVKQAAAHRCSELQLCLQAIHLKK
jgi:hypothetical protein